MLTESGWWTTSNVFSLAVLFLALMLAAAAWFISLNWCVRRKTAATRQKIEREIEAERRQQLLQRMEAIGRLAGGVAHSFNNYLTSILGFSELLLESIPAKDAARDGIEAIYKSAQRGSEFTRQLFALNRRQALQLEILDFNAILGDMDKPLHTLAGDKIELNIILEGQLGSVRTDKSQIEQVITCLVMTARDLLPKGGRITIETRNAEFREPHIQDLFELKPGSYVELSIRANGAGMDDNTRRHIFEPFFLPKQKSKGSGLALALVYNVIKQSKGEISVSSEPAKGTTFSIYFPKE